MSGAELDAWANHFASYPPSVVMLRQIAALRADLLNFFARKKSQRAYCDADVAPEIVPLAELYEHIEQLEKMERKQQSSANVALAAEMGLPHV